MNPQLNLRLFGAYYGENEKNGTDNALDNLTMSKKDSSPPPRRMPLSALSENSVKTAGNPILLTGAVRIPIKDAQIATPSKPVSKSITSGTKIGSTSKTITKQLQGGAGFMRHTESSSNHTVISTPTRNSGKRDDKAPSTDANKKHNSVSSKSSKIGDVGGFGTESNIIIESVLHTPTRSNSLGRQRRAITPVATPTSTPARQQKNYASHTASSESKHGGPTKSPLRSKDAVAKTCNSNHSDSLATYQGDINGGSSQCILFSPDRSENSHSMKNNSATKPDSAYRSNFRAFIVSPDTAEHEVSAGYNIEKEKEKASIHSISNHVRSASRSHLKSSVKMTTASTTTADILSANKAAKIAAMASVKGAPVVSVSATSNRFASRPRSSSSNKGQMKAPSIDCDSSESLKKSNLHLNKKLKVDADEDLDIKNAFNFVESSRSLIAPEHVQSKTTGGSTVGSHNHRLEANKHWERQMNSISLCELSSVGDHAEENRSAASTIELSGNSSYFIESNTQYLSFNADSFRSTDFFYEPANNNLQQSAPDDNKLIEVDTFNLSIVESPASVSPSKISLASFWSQSSDMGISNSAEHASAGTFSLAAANGNMRAYSRQSAKNHNSNTATVNAMTNFHMKESKENASSSSSAQGFDARYSDSFSLNGLPHVSSDERKTLSDHSIPSLYRNSLSTIRASGSSLDMEDMNYMYKGNSSAGVEVEHSESPSMRLLGSTSQTSMNSILNNAMIASGSMISVRSYAADEDIETTSQLLNNCMLMSDDFDVKNIVNISEPLSYDNAQDNEQQSFTESVILNDGGLNEDSLIYISQDNKNETFDTFIDDMRISEADCSYGSLTLFENLSNYIDALVASTGSVDFQSAGNGGRRQQQFLESISLPSGFENVSQLNISPFNESASVIQSSFSAIQAVDLAGFTANNESRTSSEHSDSDNLLLSPPTALSRSIEYEPVRVNVLPMPSVISTSAVSYLDVESAHTTWKVPSPVFEGHPSARMQVPADLFPMPIKVAPPSAKLETVALTSKIIESNSPASNSSLTSYTSSFEELRQHNPAVKSDTTKRLSNYGNSFGSIYCTPPRKGLLNIPISSPPPGSQSHRVVGSRTISNFMDDYSIADTSRGIKVAREEATASRASGVCPDPIAKQLLKIEEKEQSVPRRITTANVFLPVQMS